LLKRPFRFFPRCEALLQLFDAAAQNYPEQGEKNSEGAESRVLD